MNEFDPEVVAEIEKRLLNDLNLVRVQDVWEAAGGNPNIKASWHSTREALRLFDAVCQEADRTDMPREPKLILEGPVAFHNQRCAVYAGQHAVYQINEGVYHPSRMAQRDGWFLIQATTRIQKWVHKFFWGEK